MRIILLLVTILTSCVTFAKDINREWTLEAEDPSSRVTIMADKTIDIIAPKGITLWNKALMQGNTVIEYDARIVVDEANKEKWNRLSDLNCFWMATDPHAKDGSVLTNANGRSGIFVNQYALALYYLGYGGNHNSTTRFRRYDGDERGVGDKAYRPSILREYLDKDNLLAPNHWYHIRLEAIDGHVRYTIDGRCLVDYIDPQPLTKGYFGFRTTLAHAQLRNFTFTCHETEDSPIVLSWIDGSANKTPAPQSFGVPFAKGEVNASTEFSILTDKGTSLPLQSWNLATWPDGSVKWKAFATVVPENTKSIEITKLDGNTKAKGTNSKTQKPSTKKLASENTDLCKTTERQFVINNGSSTYYIPRNGSSIIDSITTLGTRTCGSGWLEANGKKQSVSQTTLEQNGPLRSTIKVDGELFTLRLYFYKGSDEVKIVHTLLVDSALNHDGMRSLGLRLNVPLRDADHLRNVSFGEKTFTVKPLIARRPISVDSQGNITDERSQCIVDAIASWDGFRLSQLSPNAFSIRKRATSVSPWIGTMEGHRAPGNVTVSDTKGGMALSLTDFWQSYPSTLQVDNARSRNADEATVSLWMWSPEAEPMSFEHYDTIAHGLEAAYEDIQPGLSTAYGIARTSTLFLRPFVADDMREWVHEDKQLALAPEYLHQKRAFGFWSLPQTDGDKDNDKQIEPSDSIEATLSRIISFYEKEIERNGWYGYFNYGDVMHSYDASRDEWRYDVGGFAWDNTELASNTMLWYSYLRSASPAAWRMAVAMARHTAEVDCYHQGPNAGLGSRHNVSHWGCGAKEARISQAGWNRFLYYLTTDERSGDLMHEVVDADQLLYKLDPMRLAQPRSERYPCTAPARLRVGPDWLAYAGNWFTEWERTGNTKYYDKIVAGMKSIASMPHGLFSGPKALGYDPATGIVSWEGDTAQQNTNHLMTIMGGFEMMNEMMMSINIPEWNRAWFDHAANYREKAIEISRNAFRIPRLKAYAYWHTGNTAYWKTAMNDLLQHSPFSLKNNFFTNDAATWTLDAIFMKEVMRQNGNPIITHMYSADPSAHVFHDTLWVYPSHDKDDAASFSMEDYHVYSTTDMVTWKDWGVIFNPIKQTTWAKEAAWAPDCVERNGKYYLYYPTDKKHIGVAVADTPYGPFHDTLGHPLISIDTPGVVCNRDFIDPCVFIDDDGQAYLFVGQNTVCAVKLNDDMISYDKSGGDNGVYIIKGVHEFFEAVWVHKRNGTYYMSYSDGPFFGHEPQISYCTATNPLGPYTYQGVILDPVNSGTNHHSIVNYKGQDYLFYHTADISRYKAPGFHCGVRRSVCVDSLHYNEDGTIQKVKPTVNMEKVRNNTVPYKK